MLAITDEEFAGMKPQGVGRECTSTPKVVHDFVDPSISPGYRVVAGDMPFDVSSQKGANRLDVAACVHRVLCLMKLIKDLLGHGTIHERIVTHPWRKRRLGCRVDRHPAVSRLTRAEHGPAEPIRCCL
jgi:hypothetical protein